MVRFVILLLAAVISFVAILFAWRMASRPGSPEAAEATYVGGEACAACHAREHKLWIGSHHDLAMQLADEASVLGDFDDATFTYYGVQSTFFERDGLFSVRTDGPDGKLHDYEIAYTFGVYPLQQYLIGFPGGRYQPLGIAWDSRPAAAGGQRWFHLYPDEAIESGDELHWTAPNQTWNFMCAACHSTNLKKNYDLETDSYNTTWSEINVSCEACHGPGSAHVEWAAGGADLDNGLIVHLIPGGEWSFETATGTARLSSPRGSHAQIETCAPCHSRRSAVDERQTQGHLLLQNYRLALLTEGMYYADGQIEDEVYVYGSFLQGKMYHAGVTCSDCHDPHSLRTRAAGNALCTRCHLSTRFDTPTHHFHSEGSTGAACVSCHMPTRTYMVIDPRLDHSIRVPRPDLSARLEAPNACNGCHDDRSSDWAARTIETWYGAQRRDEPHFGEALQAGRTGAPGAAAALARLATDRGAPGIARSSALALLRAYPSRDALRAIQRSLGDPDPLVRLGALDGTLALPPDERLDFGYPLLSDSVKSVRLGAARALAAVGADRLAPGQQVTLERGFAEYVQSQLVNADRAEAHLNLGVFYSERRQFAQAEREYRTALRLDPGFTASHVNLADLYRLMNRDDESERILIDALASDPDAAGVHHALGLLYTRRGDPEAARSALGRAAELAPENARYSFVYGIAINSMGRTSEAIGVLEAASLRHPNDREILFALATINRDSGSLDAAIGYAKRLVSLAADDPGPTRLLQQLEAMRG